MAKGSTCVCLTPVMECQEQQICHLWMAMGGCPRAVSQKETVPQQLMSSDKTRLPAEYKEVASMSTTPGMCHSVRVAGETVTTTIAP